MSDTALIWQLLKHPERSRRWIALLALQTEETNGVLPRHWDPGLMQEMLDTDEDSAYYPHVQMLAFYRNVDQRDSPAALQHLENALAAASRSGNKKLRRWCFLEAAFACGRERRNPRQARVWLERACKIERPESTDGIEAEIAMAEGMYEDAIRHWTAAQDFIALKRLDSGLARLAKERYSERENDCRIALRHAQAAGLPTPLERPRAAPHPIQPQPFPWMTIAAVALVGIAILLAVTFR
jgi:hypothetical protein